MNALEKYANHHTELSTMIEDLQSILTLEQLSRKPTAEKAHELLSVLIKKVKQHLSDEDRELYPALLVHEDPRVKSIAWGFISGERPLRRSLDDYHKRRLKTAVLQSNAAFIEDTRALLAMLTDRFEREERLLFPKLEEIEREGLLQANERG